MRCSRELHRLLLSSLLVELVTPYLCPASSARPSGCGVVHDSGRDFSFGSQEGKWGRSGLHIQLPLVWACLALCCVDHCMNHYSCLHVDSSFLKKHTPDLPLMWLMRGSGISAGILRRPRATGNEILRLEGVEVNRESEYHYLAGNRQHGRR